MTNHSKKKKKIKTFRTWETNFSEGNKTEPKHRLYKRKIRTEMESEEQICKDIKQKPQTPLWYPKKENMSEVLDHWGWRKLRKTKVREGKQVTSFYPTSPQRMLGRNLFWYLLLFFPILFFNRREWINSKVWILASRNKCVGGGW